MPYFDTHIHLTDFENININELINSLKKCGIVRCISVTATEKDWEKLEKTVSHYPDFVVPAFGLHPWYCAEASSNWAEKLEKLLIKYPSALVGECGFDRLKNVSLQTQTEAFEKQLKLSEKYNRTILIHLVKANEIFQKYLNMKVPFVIHSYNGKTEFLKVLIKNNAYISLNFNIFKNKYTEQIIKQIPQKRLLTETDAPFQSTSSEMIELIKKMALIRSENLEELATSIYTNAERLI